MPTRALIPNIDKRLVEIKGRKPSIEGIKYYDNNDEIPNYYDGRGHSPFIEYKTRLVYIGSNFMNYLWVSIFYSVYCTELANKEMIENNWNGGILPETKISKIALNLLLQVKQSFNSTCYHKWNGMPDINMYKTANDKGFDFNDISCWVGKINAIYVETMTFIILHEIAHWELGHAKNISKNTYDKEVEADKKAVDDYLPYSGLEIDSRYYRLLPVLLAFSTMLYVIPKLQSKPNSHPSLDKRWDVVMRYLDKASNESKFWHNYLLYFVMYSTVHYILNEETQIKEFETIEDAVQYYMEKLQI